MSTARLSPGQDYGVVHHDSESDNTNSTLLSHHRRLRTGPGIVVQKTGDMSVITPYDQPTLDPQATHRLVRCKSHTSVAPRKQLRHCSSLASSGLSRAYSADGSASFKSGPVQDSCARKDAAPSASDRPSLAVRRCTFGLRSDGKWTPSPSSSPVDLPPFDKSQDAHIARSEDYGWFRTASPPMTPVMYTKSLLNEPAVSASAGPPVVTQRIKPPLRKLVAIRPRSAAEQQQQPMLNLSVLGLSSPAKASTHSAPPTPETTPPTLKDILLPTPHLPAYLLRSPMRSPALDLRAESPTPAEPDEELEAEAEVSVYHLPSCAIEARSSPVMEGTGTPLPYGMHSPGVLPGGGAHHAGARRIQRLEARGSPYGAASPSTASLSSRASPALFACETFGRMENVHCEGDQADYFSRRWNAEADREDDGLGCALGALGISNVDLHFEGEGCEAGGNDGGLEEMLPTTPLARIPTRQRSLTVPSRHSADDQSRSSPLRPPKSPKRRSVLLHAMEAPPRPHKSALRLDGSGSDDVVGSRRRSRTVASTESARCEPLCQSRSPL